MQCKCEVPQSEEDHINTDYLVYHAVVAHFDHMRGFEHVQALQHAIWRWLKFCTDADKSAMGQVLLRKPIKFPDYVDQFKQNYKIDEITLWVISCILREPVAVLLKDEFWVTTEDHDISSVHILFVYGREGRYLPIVRMDPDEIPTNVPGEISHVK